MGNYDNNLTDLSNSILNWANVKKFDCPTDIDSPDTRALMLGKLMLATTELAEAAEAVRDGDNENFAEELADTIIRVLHISAACGIDMSAVLQDKMLVNEGRPERHGRKVNI